MILWVVTAEGGACEALRLVPRDALGGAVEGHSLGVGSGPLSLFNTGPRVAAARRGNEAGVLRSAVG